MAGKRSSYLTTRVDPAMRKAIDRIARLEGRTSSQVIYRILSAYLSRKQDEK